MIVYPSAGDLASASVPIAALARTLRGSGAVQHVWTVNEPAEALQLWQCGVQGIISDDPALMLVTRSRAG